MKKRIGAILLLVVMLFCVSASFVCADDEDNYTSQIIKVKTTDGHSVFLDLKTYKGSNETKIESVHYSGLIRDTFTLVKAKGEWLLKNNVESQDVNVGFDFGKLLIVIVSVIIGFIFSLVSVAFLNKTRRSSRR